MPPIPKKNPARRNRHVGAATLARPDRRRKIPQLPLDGGPEVEWHPMTVQWWTDLWRSPMSTEYDESDRHGLYLLAVLIDQFWREPTKELAGEIRLQRQCFGLTPIDRRRLQWEIERPDEPPFQTGRRRPPAKKATPARAGTDPLAALRLV